MGRIKKDHSGWRTSGLWKRFQYPKVEDEENSPVGHKKKNTRKWCKGKVGVKHDLVLIEEKGIAVNIIWATWKEYKCRNCGKRILR